MLQVRLPAAALVMLALGVAAVGAWLAPSHDRAFADARPATSSLVAAPPTTVAGPVRPDLSPPATIPFSTHRPNAHFGPFWAYLSAGGFAAFLLIAMLQFVLTRPGRRGRRTL
jgi:hypothetical protein